MLREGIRRTFQIIDKKSNGSCEDSINTVKISRRSEWDEGGIRCVRDKKFTLIVGERERTEV